MNPIDTKLLDANTSATGMSDAQATRMGLKSYAHGTTYLGGIAPTVTGPSGWSVNTAIFFPYQIQDGTWRMKFTIKGGATTTTDYSHTIVGVTYSFSGQVVTAYQRDTSVGRYTVLAQTGTTTLDCYIGTTSSTIGVFGDVALLSKPTWAY